MAKRVESTNQSGGITAESVSFNSSSSGDKDNDRDGDSRTWWQRRLRGWLGIAAAFATILGFLGGVFVALHDSDENEGRPEIVSEKNQEVVYVTSIGQSGGVTANTVEINNITQEVSHELFARQLEFNKPHGENYVTEIELSSKNVIPNVYLAAHAVNILDFDVMPQRAGGFMSGHSGKRDGYHFTNIPNFGGVYRVKITTAQPGDIRLEYGL